MLDAVPPTHKALTPDPSFRMTDQQRAAIHLMGGPQRNTLLYGGARSQKTFTIVRQLFIRALKASTSRHLITRFRNNAVWPALAMDTIPKVRRLCFPDLRLVEHKQLGYFRFPNDSELWLGGLDDGDRVEKILGNEYVSIYFNETSQIPYSSVLLAMTRLAQKCAGLTQRAYFDLNPTGKGHYTFSLFREHRDPISRQPLVNPDDYKYGFMSPKGNAENLSPEFLASLESMPARQKKRFFDGEYSEENENALWTYEIIERNRRSPEQVPELQALCVSVDPSGAKSSEDYGHDLIGLVVVGLGVDGHGYLLADGSMLGSPAQWGAMVAQLYHGSWCSAKKMPQMSADHVVGEINYGGAMVEHVIRTTDPNIPFRQVTATRGKTVRAEPVSAVYELGKFHHVGTFTELEDELCGFTNLGYLGERSPNRADALIWAAYDLKICDMAAAWIADMAARSPKNAPRPMADDGGLMDTYRKAFASLSPEPIKCARPGCTEPLSGDRVTDGINIWHPYCYAPLTRAVPPEVVIQ